MAISFLKYIFKASVKAGRVKEVTFQILARNNIVIKQNKSFDFNLEGDPCLFFKPQLGSTWEPATEVGA